MWSSYAPVLRNRQFLLLTAGQVTSQLGNYIGYIAVMALIYKLTGSSLLVATYMGAQAGMALLVGPLAGSVVDSRDKRTLMLVSDCLRGLLVLTLPFVTAAWQVILIAMLKSALATFFNPAKTALTPRILSKEQLSAAFSLEQLLGSIAQILGPAVGGILVSLIGIAGALWLDGATFFVSALSILMIRLGAPTAVSDEKGAMGQTNGWQDWVTGYKALLANPVFTRLTAMKSCSLIGVWAVNVVLVAFAFQVLGNGNTGLGLISSCLGAGTVLGSFLNAPVARWMQPFGLMGVSGIVIGLLLGSTGFATAPWFAYGLFFAAGLLIAVYNINFAVQFQHAVPERLLGRAAACTQIIDNMIVLASLAVSGYLADAFGVRPIMITGGLMVSVAGLLALTAPGTVTAAAGGRSARQVDSQPRELCDAGDSAARSHIVKPVVKVHDHAGRTVTAAMADGGENSIVIGYDGN